jgi:hypothetical protein
MNATRITQRIDPPAGLRGPDRTTVKTAFYAIGDGLLAIDKAIQALQGVSEGCPVAAAHRHLTAAADQLTGARNTLYSRLSGR